MRRIVWLLVFLVIWPLGGVARPVANEADLSLADLVREVKVALLKVAEAVEAQHLPKLDKAELEVNTSILRHQIREGRRMPGPKTAMLCLPSTTSR